MLCVEDRRKAMQHTQQQQLIYVPGIQVAHRTPDAKAGVLVQVPGITTATRAAFGVQIGALMRTITT